MSAIDYIEVPSLQKPKGHYSYATCANGFAFIAGLLPIKPDGTQMTEASFEDQTIQLLHNVDAVLASCQTHSSKLVSVRVYLVNIENWTLFNTIYSKWIGDKRPARAVVPVPHLYYGLELEIEAVAVV